MSEGSFRRLAEIISSQDFISGDKFLAFSSTSAGINYQKTDFLYRGGIWRGKPVRSLLSQAKQLQQQILILGHSDLNTQKIVLKQVARVTGVKKIYGTNLQPVPGIAEVVPLGLTNNSGESDLHKILGDTSHFLVASTRADEVKKEFDLSVYANFTIANNSRIRRKVSRILSQLPKTYSVVKDIPVMTNEGRVNYLSNLRKANFVLCPEGNGVDTHRLWETLYMGGVPIVTRSRYLNALYSKLPVVVLESWSDLLNSSMLERMWHEVQGFQWDDSLLSQTYWLNRIAKDFNGD